MKTLERIAALAGLMLLAPGGAAHAACGVGNKIWEGRDGVGAKILAFTTNVWTFKGISTTSEIAGCTEKDNLFKRGAAKAKKASIDDFASENLDHLAMDMSRGRGEHLDALARLIELREEDEVELRSLAQSHFELLFPHDHTTSVEVLRTLARLMSEDPVLSDYVER